MSDVEIYYAVYALHPDTGEVCWFLRPGEGWTSDLAEAALWRPEELAARIESARREGGDWGQNTGPVPCRIRQVYLDHDNPIPIQAELAL